MSRSARGLTGDPYFGHVFCEYRDLPAPLLRRGLAGGGARAPLMYRYHTLLGARAKADAMGYKGALYAWESADTGDETTPETRRMIRWWGVLHAGRSTLGLVAALIFLWAQR